MPEALLQKLPSLRRNSLAKKYRCFAGRQRVSGKKAHGAVMPINLSIYLYMLKQNMGPKLWPQLRGVSS